jgi:hypothetical protein
MTDQTPPTAEQYDELKQQNDQVCELNLALGRGIQSLAAEMGITEQPGTDALTIIEDCRGYNKTKDAALKEKSDLIVAFQKQIIALGWQPLTSETKWQEGTEIVCWLFNKPYVRKWREFESVEVLIQTGNKQYRRNNPPAQESPDAH